MDYTEGRWTKFDENTLYDRTRAECVTETKNAIIKIRIEDGG